MLSHFILTRFNVRMRHFKAHGGGIVAGEFRFDRGLDPGYLQERFELFDAYCYPTVQAQCCQNFTWLVFFDADTPSPFRDRIAVYAKWPSFVPIFVSGVLPASVTEVPRDAEPTLQTMAYQQAIAAHLHPAARRVLTTRLDNDDAVDRDFVASIQAETSRRSFEVLNFARGYTLSGGRLYLTVWDSNPFLSVAETLEPGQDVTTLRTALWRNHPGMASMQGYRSIETKPLWMRIAHGNNLSALPVIGRRRPVARLAGHFALGEDAMPHTEAWVSYAAEAIVYSVRVCVAVAKFALKRLILGRRVRLKDYLLRLVRQ